jgi:peptidoglycan L-alanyl-D-glutamate endopeptidase CwlK
MGSSRWSQASLNKLEAVKVAQGLSKVKFGKHNVYPAQAVDVQPYPVAHSQQDLREELAFIGGLFIAFGRARGLKLRWGGSWDRTGQTRNNAFDDYYHVEIDE